MSGSTALISSLELEMSGCALRRWGAGSGCSAAPATAASAELAAKLSAMQAEREKQDGMWTRPVGVYDQSVEKPSVPATIKKKTTQ